MNEILYPPTVQGVPPELTVPNRAYRRQVVIVLISLVIFILFYSGLTVGSGWAALYTLSHAIDTPPAESGSQSNENGYAVFGICAAVLCIFLVKALFKWHKREQDLRIEITEAEHPALFDFIRRICADTGAPFPCHIYVTPDVNAAVFYNNSVLSLFLPVKKNLIIGLGLVNGLNLSEFKAVLAHEFGHFAQSSMRLGSYVYVANRVIYDLVYHRDAFDSLLEKAKRTNIRIAVFAWLIYGVLWGVRKILEGAFRLINLFESALSRQMEFHADLVAVSITGSDSLIHALKKLEFVNGCQMQAFHDLKTASDHKIYTQDLFYHQTRAAEHLRRTLKQPDAGLVPALPADPTQRTQLFSPEDREEADGMWASHPSHYDREQNAKRHYVRSLEDERSPWLLFSNPEQLRRRMTEKFYRQALDLQMPVFTPAEQVQAFIDNEHQETTQDERYLGLYDGRLLAITPDQLTSLANDSALPAMTQDQICSVLNRLYNAEYREWQEAHTKRNAESEQLRVLEQSDSKRNARFEFRGVQHTTTDLPSLREQVDRELKQDQEWFKTFDREVFQTHLRMAQILGEGDEDLFNRYYFHLNLQDLLKVARQEEMRLMRIFAFLRQKESGMSGAEFTQIRSSLAEAWRNVSAAYEKTRSLSLPPLQNMRAGQPLNAYLLEEPLIEPLPDNDKGIKGEWVSKLGQQTSQIEERCRRVYFKSMGAILMVQEAISARYRQQILEPPTRSLPDVDREHAVTETPALMQNQQR